jgi:hypothetical protein
MRLANCNDCELPVLELRGQVAVLDSYYISEGKPPATSAGWWHARCLADSAVASAWYEARLRNHCDVRGLRPLNQLDHWTIVRHPRTGEVLAFGRRGELIPLSLERKGARRVDGGAVYPIVDDEYHLGLGDEALVQSIKDGLLSDGTYALPVLIDQLGIGDKVTHPVALERGVVRFDRKLHRDWTRWSVSASVEYGLFIPVELEPFIGRPTRPT